VWIQGSIPVLAAESLYENRETEIITLESQTRLTRIESKAFSFSSLHWIEIPRNTETLGLSCFSWCKSLSLISFQCNSRLNRKHFHLDHFNGCEIASAGHNLCHRHQAIDSFHLSSETFPFLISVAGEFARLVLCFIETDRTVLSCRGRGFRLYVSTTECRRGRGRRTQMVETFESITQFFVNHQNYFEMAQPKIEGLKMTDDKDILLTYRESPKKLDWAIIFSEVCQNWTDIARQSPVRCPSSRDKRLIPDEVS
jgi:hypothetical protein